MKCYIFLFLFFFSCAKEDLVSPSLVRSYIAIATEENVRNSEGDLLVLDDSTYLSFFTEYNTDYIDNSSAKIVCSKTTDYGKSWKKQFILCEGLGRENVMSVSIVKIAELNEAHCYFCVGNTASDMQIGRIRSTDNFKTWFKPEIITNSGYSAVLNNSVLNIGKGEIMIPIYHKNNVDDSNEKCSNYVLKSKDYGKTWEKSNAMTIESDRLGGAEPNLVQISSSVVLMNIRTSHGVQYFSESFDGIKFTSPSPSSLVSSDAPAKLYQLSCGALIAVHNNYFSEGVIDYNHRNPLVISLYNNRGTWDSIYTIEYDSEYCKTFAYPSVTEYNNRLLITYWERVVSTGWTSLKFRSIPMEDLFR